MNLVIGRNYGQRVRLKFGDSILWVTVKRGINSKQVKLAFEGPLEIEVMREEILAPCNRYDGVFKE